MELSNTKIRNLIPALLVKEHFGGLTIKKQNETLNEVEKNLPEFFTGKVVFVGKSGGKRAKAKSGYITYLTFFMYENGKRSESVCDICFGKVKAKFGPVAACEEHYGQLRSLSQSWIDNNLG